MTRFYLVMLTIAGAGCGRPGTSASALADVCAQRAQAQCNRRSECSAGTGIVHVYGDMATCLQRTQLSCEMGLKAPDTGQTTALVNACAAAYMAQSCADYLNGVQPTPCAPTGSRPDGAACAYNAQCQSGYCGGTRTAVCGTCKAPPVAGDSCAVDNCAAGQSCIPSTLLCQPLGAVGDACDSTHFCGNDLGCAGPGSRTCKSAVRTVGASCDANNVCDGTLALHCESHSGMPTCTPNVVAADGMSCGVVGSTYATCSDGGLCYTSTGQAPGAQTGTCKAAAADGGACDTQFGPPCLSPARCVVASGQTRGVCTVADATTCG
jgi:hypothetical protein